MSREAIQLRNQSSLSYSTFVCTNIEVYFLSLLTLPTFWKCSGEYGFSILLQADGTHKEDIGIEPLIT